MENISVHISVLGIQSYGSTSLRLGKICLGGKGNKICAYRQSGLPAGTGFPTPFKIYTYKGNQWIAITNPARLFCHCCCFFVFCFPSFSLQVVTLLPSAQVTWQDEWWTPFLDLSLRILHAGTYPRIGWPWRRIIESQSFPAGQRVFLSCSYSHKHIRMAYTWEPGGSPGHVHVEPDSGCGLCCPHFIWGGRWLRYRVQLS